MNGALDHEVGRGRRRILNAPSATNGLLTLPSHLTAVRSDGAQRSSAGPETGTTRIRGGYASPTPLRRRETQRTAGERGSLRREEAV